MNDNDTSDTAIFNFDFSGHFKINKRIGVRYPAPSLKLQLLKKNLLSINSELSGKLIDISAKGALVSCTESLYINTKLGLKIVFVDGTLFNLKGTVVREQAPHYYGVKFDIYNKVLESYLQKLLGSTIPEADRHPL
jgi:hypothetical protein